MPNRRPVRLAFASIVLIGAAVLALAPAAAAVATQASLGSVPVVVADYVASGQLQTRLAQVYGPGATKGSGVDFDATTKPGPISRVYEWTDDRYAHADSDHPIQLTNYWTVPITIAGKPVGVAAVWINPTSDRPELAEFTKSASLATALAAVPADAALVHDGATAAWYGVAKQTATPLVEGRSGVTKPTPVADLVLARATPATQPGAVGGTGIGLAVAVLVLLVLVIVATVLLPRFLRPRGEGGRERRRGAIGTGSEPEPISALAQAETPAPVPASAPESGSAPTSGSGSAPAPKPRTPTKPRPTTSAAPAKPRTPVTQKPAASKPTGTKPVASRTAATKPRASKPPASKPPASKPTTSNPPAPKPPTSEPPTSKPPTPRTRPEPPTDETPDA